MKAAERSRTGSKADKAGVLERELEALKLAAGAAGFGIFEYDCAAGMFSFSTEGRRILQLRKKGESVQLGDLLDRVHVDDRVRTEKCFKRAMDRCAGGKRGSYRDEFRVNGSKGLPRWVQLRGQVFQAGEGTVCGGGRVVGIVMDVTHRRLAEGAMRESHGLLEQSVAEHTEQLRRANVELEREIEDRTRLERELLAVVEKERERIARELHDSVGQQLTGLGMFHRILTNGLVARNLPEAETAKKQAKLMEEIRDEVRRISRGLYPIGNEPEALLAGLNDFAASVSELHQVACKVVCTELVAPPNAEVATHLFRIAQEAVNNALRHGRAKKIKIGIRRRDRHMLLEIADDGRWVEPADATPGLGLRIMNARAEAVGAEFRIERKPRGTTAVCICPLTRAEERA